MSKFEKIIREGKITKIGEKIGASCFMPVQQ
jgi:hypothetical protein